MRRIFAMKFWTFPSIGMLGLLFVQALETCAASSGVTFPGPQPGPAQVTQQADVLTLENGVIAASWKVERGSLHPLALVDKLSGSSSSQGTAELFRLALQPVAAQTNGVYVAIRLDADKVVALASKDGVAWLELATYARADFAGEPKLVRIGKMNLKAEAKDNSDHGPVGAGEIGELSLPSAGRFAFKTGAHQSATKQFPFPQGSKNISCRIDKGTDQGLSWGPALALIWEEGEKFLLVGVREQKPTFNLTTVAGETIKSAALGTYPAFELHASAFRLAAAPRVRQLLPDAHGVRVAEQVGGVAIEAELVSANGIRARWLAELRDESNYIRKTLELSSPKTIALNGVELTDVSLPGARTIGSVPGCPVVAGNQFFGVEIPGAQNALNGSGARIGFACRLELSPAQAYAFGSVAGVAPAGQLRRAFLYYVERERARPSKPFLHYNCWYDLGFGLDEARLLDVARSFDAELVQKRGVPVMSYLADDGWDEPRKGLWVENSAKFPRGFAGLNAKLKDIGAHLSVWISPLGGYGGAQERTAWARKLGLIPAESGLDLAQPAYKKWFQERCLQLMREAGVNAFKWDKAGEGVSQHFMALLDVARRLHRENPEVFINVTVGTWPSPFWLNHVDATWRNGSADVGWAGQGDDREKWLTFRDGNCRKYFVEKSPLYPLNSAMHHGIVHGRCFQGDKVGKSGAQLKNEARSYFANGASLQELYLTPSMMTADAWDRVAESARWAHANADVLVDAHWLGGDPLKLEVYGYAAWNPRKGTLMLRNPGTQPQAFSLDATTVFELPAGAPQNFALRAPFRDQRLQTLSLKAGATSAVTLEPFEVLVFDAEAVR